MFVHKTRMSFLRSLVTAALLCASSSAFCDEPKSLTDAQKMEIALEALSRIKGDINSDPQLKTAVYKLLAKVEGTPQFVQIVKRFDIRDQDKNLLNVAVAQPAEEAGVEAMRLVLAHDNEAMVQANLASSDATIVSKTAEALGNTKEKRAVSLLLPIVTETKRDVVTRKLAIKALAQTQEGAEALLDLARKEAIASDVKLTASTELNGVRWAKIKKEAGQVLPLPQGKNAEPLPAISELAKITGSAANGEQVFYREQVTCASCHRIKGRGAEIGPDLSEIGSKLGKDALFEAIIEPSAGISLGYEAFTLDLKSGDEAYGLLVSQTADEIAIKDLKGIVTRFKTSEVEKKRQLKTSIMPTGLAANMSTQELVDLVQFLSGLKKAE